MLLDLQNNELIFSKIDNKSLFNRYLMDMKGTDWRQHRDRYYFSLADIEKVRKKMPVQLKGELSLSVRYERFAQKFILSKGPIKITWGPVHCRIQGPDLPWTDILKETSYFDKRAFNAKTYGKSWSGYTHLFDPIEGKFPSGLLERILNILTKHNLPYQIEQTFQYPSPTFHLNPSFDFEPTEDQIAAVEALAKANNGIAKLPTGFGKTAYVAAALIAKKGVPSLFLANQRVLTDDAKTDFEKVFRNDKIKIGMIGDGEFEPGDITIASIQSIASALKPPTNRERQLNQYQKERLEYKLSKTDDEDEAHDLEKEIKRLSKRLQSIDKRIQRHKALVPFLKNVQLFIVDESQVLGTEQWNLFLKSCPAPYRYTLSATDTRTDGGRIQIVAATGERRFESTAAEQIEKGRLAEFTANFQKFDHGIDKELMKQIDIAYHQAYDLFIVQNEKRNDFLCNQVIKWAREHSVLALVTRKEHGDIVRRILMEKGLKEEECHYIDGDTPKKKRKETIEAFRKKEFPVLIGTSIFDVGFNAKNAAKMVRFNAGASEVRETQRAGRTVRKREDDSIGETFDLIDMNVPFFQAQGWKRMKLLREEFGHERIKFHSEIIQGDLNIIGLKEIVSAMPKSTDKEKMEGIIQGLELDEVELTDNDEEYNIDDLEPQLLDFLNELSN